MDLKETIRRYLLSPADDTRVQLLRSLVVGGLASVLDMLVLALLYERFGVSELWATAAGFVFGLALNFVLTRAWVFAASRFGSLMEFVTFAVIGVLGLALTEGIVWVFVHPLTQARLLDAWLTAEQYIYPGKIVAIVLVFFWNFFLRKWIVYRR